MLFLKRLTAAASALLVFLASPGVCGAGRSTDASLPDLNLPSLGTVAGADLSLQDERDIGEAFMKEIRADKDYLADPEITDYLNRLAIGDRRARTALSLLFLSDERPDAQRVCHARGLCRRTHGADYRGADRKRIGGRHGSRNRPRRATPYCPHDQRGK